MAKKTIAKTATELKQQLIDEGWPTKTRASGKVVLVAPNGKPTKLYRQWRTAKAAQRRPAGID